MTVQQVTWALVLFAAVFYIAVKLRQIWRNAEGYGL